MAGMARVTGYKRGIQYRAVESPAFATPSDCRLLPGLPIFVAAAYTLPLGRKLESEIASRMTKGG